MSSSLNEKFVTPSLMLTKEMLYEEIKKQVENDKQDDKKFMKARTKLLKKLEQFKVEDIIDLQPITLNYIPSKYACNISYTLIRNGMKYDRNETIYPNFKVTDEFNNGGVIQELCIKLGLASKEAVEDTKAYYGDNIATACKCYGVEVARKSNAYLTDLKVNSFTLNEEKEPVRTSHYLATMRLKKKEYPIAIALKDGKIDEILNLPYKLRFTNGINGWYALIGILLFPLLPIFLIVWLIKGAIEKK